MKGSKRFRLLGIKPISHDEAVYSTGGWPVILRWSGCRHVVAGLTTAITSSGAEMLNDYGACLTLVHD